MNFELHFETTLQLFGLGCILFVIFRKLGNYVNNQEQLRANPAQIYKNLNRDSIIGGLGAVALLYLAIYNHDFPQIGIMSLSLVYTTHAYWDRNRKLKQGN